jgi:osmotically-inducible protein OsmY
MGGTVAFSETFAMKQTALTTLSKTFILGAALALGVSGCTPLGAVMGVGAATGIAAYQERGVDGVARDMSISTRIFDMYARTDVNLLKKIGVEVYEGRAMLTGIVDNETTRAEAVRLAWKADGVTDVINEITVTSDTSMFDTARDTWISTELQTALTFDERVLAINYAVETVAGTVYLMGIAQNAAELQRVIDHARSISYVQHIVSHVRVKSATQSASIPPENSSEGN